MKINPQLCLEVADFFFIFAACSQKNENKQYLNSMTPSFKTTRRNGIVSDRNSVSFSYRSPLGERKVTLSHAFIAKSASRAYARVVTGKK